MRRMTRATLRGKPLDNDCKRANRTTHEFGMKDNRVFCFGLFKELSNYEIADKCIKCEAYVDNAKPIKEK